MRFLSLLCLSFILFTCQNGSTPATAPVETVSVDGQEYEMTPVAGSEAQQAIKRDPIGSIIEQGFVLNGLKQGTWTTFNQDSKAPEKIMSYIDGALNGPYIEVDKQGRFALIANYKANVLHGHYGKYRIGRPELTANYVDGLLDGVMAEYNYRNNKIKQEVSYKMGLKDGYMRYYNDEGEITLEYLYKDDKRISGGITEDK